MANRVQRTNYEKKELILKEFIPGEVIEVKDGEKLEKGQILIFDNTEKKYTKYTKTSLGSSNIHLIRVYKGEDKTITSEDNKAVVLRQGLLNKALVKGIEEEDYDIIGLLEVHNIYLEEVR